VSRSCEIASPNRYKSVQTVTFPLARKLFHASGVLVVVVYAGVPLERAAAAWLLGGVVVLLALLDLVRWRAPAVQAVFQRTLRTLLDPKDRYGLNTSTLYFASCFLAVLVAPRDPACGGILALALGDPSAAIVGSNVRSPRFRTASVAGCAACFVAASLGCLCFAPWPHALLGGACAMVLEAVSGAKLDNLSIPTGTALLLASLA
jgi:dolichol kinase